MRILIIIFLCFSLNVTNGQTIFSFKKIDIETMYKIESENKSEFVDSIEFSLNLDNFSTFNQKKTKTFIFKRTLDDFYA